jgi:hypothetical protein
MTAHNLKISESLSLPIDAATQTFAFIARRGAGKTYAAGKLCELLMDAEVQVVVLDSVGNWYGLRIGSDGKSHGYDVPVIGGLRGDVPLEATGGQLIADVVVNTGRSLILDISQFSLSDRKRFCTAFGERLWLAKKRQARPAPLMLVIEESQLIIPQHVGRNEAHMVGIFEEIIRLGRNYGIGVMMISQRPQSVNKEVLNQAECLLVGQVNGSQERKALQEWIVHQGMDKNLVDELPSLPVGTMYVWSPQWLRTLQKIKVLPKKTHDASATPRVGESSKVRELKPLNLDDLKDQMAATIERAKQDDPRLLRAEIQKLKLELQKKAQPTSAAPDKKQIEAAVSQVRKELELQYEQEFKEFQSLAHKFMFERFDEIERWVDIQRDEMKDFTGFGPDHLKKKLPKNVLKPQTEWPKPKGTESFVAAPIEADGLSGPERRILKALGELRSIEKNSPRKEMIAAWAGYAPNGGAFNNPLGSLRSRGLVSGTSLTSAGIGIVGDQPAPDETEIHRRIMEILNGPERRILAPLMEERGKAISKDDLARRAGYSEGGGAFNNPLGSLRTKGFVDYPERGMVQASEWLFL